MNATSNEEENQIDQTTPRKNSTTHARAATRTTLEERDLEQLPKYLTGLKPKMEGGDAQNATTPTDTKNSGGKLRPRVPVWDNLIIETRNTKNNLR